MWRIDFLKFGSHMKASDSYHLELRNRELSLRRFHESVNHLNRPMESLSFEAVVLGNLVQPVHQNESHVWCQVCLLGKDVEGLVEVIDHFFLLEHLVEDVVHRGVFGVVGFLDILTDDQSVVELLLLRF